MAGLDILSTRTGGAAENMALDFLLLQRAPPPVAARFRHYEWRAPAFTFGYSQKIEFIRARLPAGGPFDLCRRPTGGGLVDHRDDWTYTLIFPRGHAWEEMSAVQCYREVHECLAGALGAQGVPAQVQPRAPLPAETGDEPAGPAGICFQRAEIYDVVHTGTGEKIAGAAQKRNKRGLLMQGSIWRPAAGAVDWDRFGDEFAARISAALHGPACPAPWPELDETEVSGLTEQYSSPEWMEHR
jgi:lipoyl(octanoyl) transferase